MSIKQKLQKTIYGAWAGWNDFSMLPDAPEWDSYEGRQLRYYYAERLYQNTFYDDINAYLTRVQSDGLYKHTRGIYNPVERLVDGYAAFVYGGGINTDTFINGALPIAFDKPSLLEPTRLLVRRSNLRENLTLYPRFAGRFGDGFIKVVEHENQVIIEFVDPRKVHEVQLNPLNRIDFIRFVYVERDENDKEYLRVEEVDEYQIRIYRQYDGQTYDEDRATLYEAWDNPYGFVPVTMGKFKDVGRRYGRNAFHAQIAKIHAINDTASIINDSIRNAMNPLVHAEGVSKGTFTTNKDESSRDMVRVLYTAQGAKINILASPIDIIGATESLKQMLNELASDQPILALHQLREMSAVTAPGIIAAYRDAIMLILDVQSSLDSPLERAMVMALAIMGYRGQAGGLGLDFYTNYDYSLRIKPRPVITDELSAYEEVQILSQVDPTNPALPLILERLDYSATAIEDAQNRADTAQRRAVDLQLGAANLRGLNSFETLGAGILEDDDTFNS